MEKISIVVPAHNEEQNVSALFASLTSLVTREKWDCEIVLVNDNSQDNTGKVAEELAKKHKGIVVIHRSANPGMGNALKEGTQKASGTIIIWTMADLSDNPETFPAMVEKIRQGNDLVFGSRYIPGGSRGDLSVHKAFLSHSYSLLAKLLFGLKVHDITNAFRCFRKDVFNAITLEAGDFAISPEFAIKAHQAGFKLSEVPTTYTNRKAGKTTFNILKMGNRYLSLFKYCVKKQPAHQ